jgi:hypothetical protein
MIEAEEVSEFEELRIIEESVSTAWGYRAADRNRGPHRSYPVHVR